MAVDHVKDQFRGINTIDDPEDLKPGECLDCRNMYVEGKSLKSRPRAMHLATAPASTYLPTNVLGMYWANNIQTTLFNAPGQSYYEEEDKVLLVITEEDIPTSVNMKLWRAVWRSEAGRYIPDPSGDYYTEIGEIATLENEDRHTLRWLEWDQIVVFYSPTGISTTNGVDITQITPPLIPAQVPELRPPTIPFDYGFVGTANYIFRYIDKRNGQYEQHAVSDITITSSTTVDSQIRFRIYFTPDMQANPDQWVLQIYRQDIITDGVADANHFQVKKYDPIDSIWPGLGTFETWDDITTTDKKLVTEKADPVDTAIEPTGWVNATWYQARVAWANQDGTLALSMRENPFRIVDESAEEYIVEKRHDISCLVEYQGSLIIFTTDGIFFLVGTIGNRVSEGNYTIYRALGEKWFLPLKKVVVIDNYMYIIAKDGLYRYDARTLTYLGRKIYRDQWENLQEDDLNELRLVPDESRKLVLIGVPGRDKVYCYRYEKQFSFRDPDGEIPAGDWTIWDITVSDMETAYPNLLTQRSELMYPIFSQDQNIWQLYTQNPNGILEPEFTWSWESKEFDGGDELTWKRWEEFRLKTSTTTTVVFEETDTNSASDRTATIVPTNGHLNAQRVRIRRRKKELRFVVSGTQPVTLGGFGLWFNRLGR